MSVLAVVLLPLVCYGAAALVGAVIPVNRGFVMAAQGHPVWLCSNGIHTDLVLPAGAGPIDWPATLPPGLFRVAPGTQTAFSFGWGDRDFYMSTPHWRDLRLATALKAIAGGDATAVHIELRPGGGHDPGCREFRLGAATLARLDGAILDAMVRDPRGRPILIPGASYGPADGFVAGTGHYSIFLTCNDWLRRALARAGMRTALWSPFPFGLIWQAKAAGAPAGR
jgi:uncharacterized protein (TIGR02117 family)